MAGGGGGGDRPLKETKRDFKMFEYLRRLVHKLFSSLVYIQYSCYEREVSRTFHVYEVIQSLATTVISGDLRRWLGGGGGGADR